MSDGGEWRAFPLKRLGVVVGVGVVVGGGAVHLHVEEPSLVACFQVSGLKEGRHRGQGLGRGHEGRGRGQEGGGRGHGVGWGGVGGAPGQSGRWTRGGGPRWSRSIVVGQGHTMELYLVLKLLHLETRKPFYIIIQNYTKRSKFTKG